MDNDKIKAFATGPIVRTTLSNAVPAMAAMLMVLVYNLADTFFIGQTHDAILVAAVSLATPVFLVFMSIGTIFGIGGTSVISRALGENRVDYAKKVCSFCMYGCLVVGMAMSALFLFCMDPILRLVGASEETWVPTKTYLTIVSFSGPFVLVANCFNNVIRAEGRSGVAMAGQVVGNLLNVVLDPLMILAFGWGIQGAAIATVIGNLVAAWMYIAFFLSGKSSLGIGIRHFTLKEGVFSSVFAIGVPASLGSILMSVSNIVVNSLMAGYGDMALAGIGVAMKVTMVTGMICIGFGQGVQALLGYCVGARLWDRFKRVMRFSILFSFALSTAMTLLCYLSAGQLVGAFLSDVTAIAYGTRFVSILLSTSFLFGVYYVLANALQAMGAATPALIVNISRQGLIFIPMQFILRACMGVDGIVWAQPVADVLSTILVVVLFRNTMRSMQGLGRR